MSFTRTGAKCERGASYCSPKMRAKNLADASLCYAGTIVWSSTIGMVMSPDAPIPTLMAPGVCAAHQASEHLSRLSGRRHEFAECQSMPRPNSAVSVAARRQRPFSTRAGCYPRWPETAQRQLGRYLPSAISMHGGLIVAVGHAKAAVPDSVRSFGRREAYESLRGTNPRTQTLVYGYFCFRLSMAKSRPVVAGAGRDAICPNCR